MQHNIDTIRLTCNIMRFCLFLLRTKHTKFIKAN